MNIIRIFVYSYLIRYSLMMLIFLIIPTISIGISFSNDSVEINEKRMDTKITKEIDFYIKGSSKNSKYASLRGRGKCPVGIRASARVCNRSNLSDKGKDCFVPRNDGLIFGTALKNKALEKLLLKTENKKATAIILAITMGPLGVHRLYLGTEVKVPVIYAATLGCVGILPISDIIAILLSKNIEKFENNPKVIMWIE